MKVALFAPSLLIVQSHMFSSVSRLGVFHPYVVAVCALRSFQHKERVCFDALRRKEPSKSNSRFALADDGNMLADVLNECGELVKGYCGTEFDVAHVVSF